MNTVRARQLAGSLLPPLVLGALFLGAWQWWVVAYDVQPFVIPKPTAIWQSFVDDFSLVWNASLVPGTNALVGVGAGAPGGHILARRARPGSTRSSASCSSSCSCRW